MGGDLLPLGCFLLIELPVIPAEPPSSRSDEGGGELNVRRPAELVHQSYPGESQPAGGENRSVTREADGVAGDGRDPGKAGAGDLAHLRLGAGTGWIDRDGVEAGELGGKKRTPEEVTGFAGQPAQTGGGAPADLKGGERFGIGFHGMNLGMLQEWQRKRAGARKEVHDPAGRPDRVAHGVRQSAGAVFRRLEEAAGGRDDPNPAEGLPGRPPDRDGLPVPGQPGEIMLLRERGDPEAERDVERLRLRDRHIEAGLAKGDREPHRSGPRCAEAGQCMERRHRGHEFGAGDRALLHCDDLVATGGTKSDESGLACATPGEGGAASRAGRGDMRRTEGRIEATRGKGGADNILLPSGEEAVAGVLEGAAAAGAKMPAGRDNAARRSFRDAGDSQALRPASDPDAFARQREWDAGAIRRNALAGEGQPQNADLGRTAGATRRIQSRPFLHGPGASIIVGETEQEASMPKAIAPETRIGHVHLRVADLDRAIAFYCDVLGFELTQRHGPQAAFLSAGGYHHHIGLNTWESRGGTPPPAGHTGLYHLAILYPTRADLADALRRVVEASIPIDGAADHGVSEAVYLRDPDGNGVELYRDRPEADWPRDTSGGLKMVNAPLDLRALLAEAP